MLKILPKEQKKKKKEKKSEKKEQSVWGVCVC